VEKNLLLDNIRSPKVNGISSRVIEIFYLISFAKDDLFLYASTLA
jgi:hypothetical protein